MRLMASSCDSAEMTFRMGGEKLRDNASLARHTPLREPDCFPNTLKMSLGILLDAD